jgi:hypothetical protein
MSPLGVPTVIMPIVSAPDDIVDEYGVSVE